MFQVFVQYEHNFVFGNGHISVEQMFCGSFLDIATRNTFVGTDAMFYKGFKNCYVEI
jgi:hypothetical protein